jgi:hypothetical protein
MRKKRFTLLLSVAVLLSITLLLTTYFGSEQVAQGKTANREVILKNDNTNEERNQLLTEDIKYFKKELPKRHKNLFHTITKQEFNDRTDELIGKIDQLNNKQVFTELNKIIASVGDAHTTVNYWDGYSYPLQFRMFGSEVYVVNADTSLEGMMFSKVIKIDGIEINSIIEKLKPLISHENESWERAKLPSYLQAPVFMYGLGIIKDENKAVFTVQKDGNEQDYTVSSLEYGKTANFVNKKTEDVLIGYYNKYYDYKYMSGNKALYFQYNVCADMENRKFADFNKEMFEVIEKNKVEKVIIDLRNNSGGNSEILNPFTKRLKSYIAKNAKVKVYILVGRNTFSSGMFAIYRVKESAPEAISVGEPTGGALDCYGEVKTLNLPNSQLPVSYSTKYFKFSNEFKYKNKGVGTFLPDRPIQPTIEDFKNGTDVVLNFALTN